MEEYIMANIAVVNFTLTVDDIPVDTVSNMLFFKLRIEYEGGPNGIKPGDTIRIEIDNEANTIFRMVGFGNEIVSIFGDDPIGRVGTRQYRNDTNGNYYLDVIFDTGYDVFYGGNQPANLTGWIEASAYTIYRREVVGDDTMQDLEAYINGAHIPFLLKVAPGGSVGPGPNLDYPGAIISKGWRYGAYSGNLYDLPEVQDNDYTQLEPMRFTINIGDQNLTWRDLRASEGARYYTTPESLAYSNDHPTGNPYQSVNEPYIKTYADEFNMGEINNPYLYENATLDDYLSVGMHFSTLTSAHEYVADSIRIIRVMGREAHSPWWGHYAFRSIVDSNFLIPDASEPIDRFLTDSIFPGNRGLTLEEFLAQMHREGQLLDAATVDDIFTMDYVNNSESPFSESSTDDPLIAHFKLKLGNLHFGNTLATVNLIGTDNSVYLEDMPATNLPYSYMIYYDTQATEALLHNGYFHYYNAAEFSYDNNKHTDAATDSWIKLEDASGGSGAHKEVRIRKVDPEASPIAGIVFRLTQVNVTPLRIREATTTINGTASFTLGVGDYLLEEIVAEKQPWKPIPPIEFSVVSSDAMIDLTTLLSPDYSQKEDIDFVNSVNIITNQMEVKPVSVSVILMANKEVVGAELVEDMFEFGVFEDDALISTGKNDAMGQIIFDEIEYDEPGVHEYMVRELISK